MSSESDNQGSKDPLNNPSGKNEPKDNNPRKILEALERGQPAEKSSLPLEVRPLPETEPDLSPKGPGQEPSLLIPESMRRLEKMLRDIKTPKEGG